MTASCPVPVCGGGKMVRISFRLPSPLLYLLDEYARERRTARSAVIRYAISQMLEKMRKVAEEQTPAQATL